MCIDICVLIFTGKRGILNKFEVVLTCHETRNLFSTGINIWLTNCLDLANNNNELRVKRFLFEWAGCTIRRGFKAHVSCFSCSFIGLASKWKGSSCDDKAFQKISMKITIQLWSHVAKKYREQSEILITKKGEKKNRERNLCPLSNNNVATKRSNKMLRDLLHVNYPNSL